MANFLQKILGIPQGSPGLGEALGVIGKDMKKKRDLRRYGDYVFDQPMKTAYGTVETPSALQEDYMRAVAERNQELDRDWVGEGIMNKMEAERPQAQPLVKGIQDELTSQRRQPQEHRQPQSKEQPRETAYDVSGIPQDIYDYATGYRYSPGGETGGSRLDDKNLSILYKTIKETYPEATTDQHNMLLANLVAVAQAESGMGGAYGNPEWQNYRDTNYWNWFKGGDRNYDPQNFQDMANDIVPGLGGYTMDTGGRFTRDNASTYTGNDNLSFWYDDIYNPAMRAMGY